MGTAGRSVGRQGMANTMRILIAEDDAVSRRVLQAHLVKWGYEVVTASDGRQAWEALRKPGAPSLAILDWMMPAVDGIELVRRLRADASAPYVYVLLLSARGQKEDLLAGFEAGADDYVTKPFDAAELQARLRTGRRILDLQAELIAAREAQRIEATHDHLTEVWNRAGILEILQRECSRAFRAQGTVALIMGDLDHFKVINDTYGHLAGDDVLREAARRMQSSIRVYDSIGRFGGEEFIIVLPDCQAPSAMLQAERLRQGIRSIPFETSGAAISVTLSLGVAAAQQTAQTDYRMLLRLADAALYKAKEAGRDQACLAPKEDLSTPVR